MKIKQVVSNQSIRAPVFRALVLVSNLLLFRLYASYHGAEGVAFISALTSLYSFWIVADFGLLSIIVREKSKHGSSIQFSNLKQGVGGLLLKCASTVWVVSSVLIILIPREKIGDFSIELLLINNFIFFISLLTSVYERQLFALGKYSIILLIQITSNIIASAVIYFFSGSDDLFLYITAITVTLIPLITNIICYVFFKQYSFSAPSKESVQGQKPENFFTGDHWYFVLLTGFSIIGNSYDAYLFYQHTSATTVVTFVGVVKLVTPFYSLLQSFIIQNWPVWENKLFTSRDNYLPLIIKEVNNMQLQCVALSAPFLIVIAIFGTLMCKIILNLDIINNGILQGICLYRLCTAYVEPLAIALTTEGFMRKYVRIIAVLNLALIFVKSIWLIFIQSHFFYLFAACGLLNIFFIGYQGKSLLLKRA